MNPTTFKSSHTHTINSSITMTLNILRLISLIGSRRKFMRKRMGLWHFCIFMMGDGMLHHRLCLMGRIIIVLGRGRRLRSLGINFGPFFIR